MFFPKNLCYLQAFSLERVSCLFESLRWATQGEQTLAEHSLRPAEGALSRARRLLLAGLPGAGTSLARPVRTPGAAPPRTERALSEVVSEEMQPLHGDSAQKIQAVLSEGRRNQFTVAKLIPWEAG